MPHTEFGVIYDGPALADGEMDVRDLAPSLLALGDLFVAASTVVEPGMDPASLTIKATRQGSFIVDLALTSHGLWGQVVDMFSGDTATAILQLKELVIGGGCGLFWLMRKLHGRRVVSRSQPDAAGKIRLALDDDTTVEIAASVYDLYQRVEVRKSVREFVAPLARDGIDSIAFTSRETTTSVVLHSPDLEAFDVPVVEPSVLVDDSVEMVLSIASVAFTDGNKWRLADGEQTFHARMTDLSFLDRIDRGVEVFRKGDWLRCTVRILQRRTSAGLQTDREIIRVIEHIPSGVQMGLQDPPPEAH